MTNRHGYSSAGSQVQTGFLSHMALCAMVSSDVAMAVSFYLVRLHQDIATHRVT
jgi:hypothetical protein